MNVVDLPLDRITAAPWNANRMDEPMHGRLVASLGRYGLVQPLLVHRQGDRFETIAGAQRLGVLRARGEPTAPCIVLDDLSDADARLLSVALNRIGGSDDPNALGAIAREALAVLPAEGWCRLSCRSRWTICGAWPTCRASRPRPLSAWPSN